MRVIGGLGWGLLTMRVGVVDDEGEGEGVGVGEGEGVGEGY